MLDLRSVYAVLGWQDLLKICCLVEGLPYLYFVLNPDWMRKRLLYLVVWLDYRRFTITVTMPNLREEHLLLFFHCELAHSLAIHYRGWMTWTWLAEITASGLPRLFEEASNASSFTWEGLFVHIVKAWEGINGLLPLLVLLGWDRLVVVSLPSRALLNGVLPVVGLELLTLGHGHVL